MTQDDLTFEALEVYDAELRRWRVVPVESSQYNDHGILKYKEYYVIDDMESVMDYKAPVGPVAMTQTIERHILKADFARQFPRLRAMQKVVEFLRK